MPTLTLPRNLGSRAGAAAAVTALTAAGATWLAAPSAVAQTNGDIRIHRVGVPFGVTKDDPLVCRFYLDATNFGADVSVTYRIEPQPPAPTGDGYNGSITLAGGVGQSEPLGLADGQYRLIFPNVPEGTVPPRREKIFRVNCHDENGRREGAQGPGGQGPGGRIGDPGERGEAGDRGGRSGDDSGRGEGDQDQRGTAAAAGKSDSGGPRGGVHAGGGGLAARTAAAFSPVTGAAAVGLVVVSGLVYLRLIRRRPYGAA
ncbi:hypothetical protein [Streptomyces sp. NPDC004065]|uniref:hypothetical protein n=1 Tax=Streptomyces sp. NPDC004065 TaxID=3364689 RepID=UPI00384F230A